MKEIEERLNHIGELVRGLSEQTSGNITIINANCQMLANRLEEIEKKLQELEDFNTPAEQKLELLRKQIDKVDKRLEELETKTSSDLSQKVVAEIATSEKQNFLWVARDKRTDTLYVYEVEPVEQYCETFAADDEEEKSFRINFDLFPEVNFENSPQKLVLESAISKTETVEDSSGSPEIPEDQSDGYVPTVDDFFYTHEKENSEKPNNQDFDMERALELVRDIESCTINNANSATKAILNSCIDLQRMLGGSDD